MGVYLYYDMNDDEKIREWFYYGINDEKLSRVVNNWALIDDDHARKMTPKNHIRCWAYFKAKGMFQK